jgi:hypothetical protein
MDKPKVQEALARLYGMLDDSPDARRGRSSSEDFLIIGGSALVMQDVIAETPDIDMVPERMADFYSAEQALKRRGIAVANERTSSKDMVYILKFLVKGREYEIFNRAAAAEVLAGRLDACDSVGTNGMKFRVRPVEMLEKDCLRVLMETESQDPEVLKSLGSDCYLSYCRKLEKYRDRVRTIQDFAHSQLYK